MIALFLSSLALAGQPTPPTAPAPTLAAEVHVSTACERFVAGKVDTTSATAVCTGVSRPDEIYALRACLTLATGSDAERAAACKVAR